jgi:hypothetical protein
VIQRYRLHEAAEQLAAGGSVSQTVQSVNEDTITYRRVLIGEIFRFVFS